MTTSTNIELLPEWLGPSARQVEFAQASTWYPTPSSALDGYRAFLGTMLDAGAPWVRIVGDPVWPGESDSDVLLWTRYESLVNLVFSAAPATILCTYDARALNAEIVRQASVTHPHTIGPDGVISSTDYADPSGFVLGA